MATVTYRVPGMTCEHCVHAVKTEVGRVSGVERVEIDLESKLVEIVGSDLNGSALIAAIDEAGYDAEPIG